MEVLHYFDVCNVMGVKILHYLYTCHSLLILLNNTKNKIEINLKNIKKVHERNFSESVHSNGYECKRKEKSIYLKFVIKHKMGKFRG